jgi:hypothetical protein
MDFSYRSRIDADAETNMQEVRLHLASTGEVWAMTKCRTCGDVDKFLLAEALANLVPCRRCGSRMDIRNATIEAADNHPGLGPDMLPMAAGTERSSTAKPDS